MIGMMALWGMGVLCGSAQAGSMLWPDLSAPEAVGGGDKDAAVIVALEDYNDVGDIPGAKANGLDWYSYLTDGRGIPASRTQLLIDRDATREGIIDALDRAAEQVEADGTLWFVFIGHGAPSEDGQDGILVGWDTQQTASSVYARGLPQSEALSKLSAGAQGQTFAVIDACFSGRSGSDGALVEGLQPMVPSYAMAAARSTVVLSAGTSRQFAGPLPGLERPAFSYLALGALWGWGDADESGSVSAEEVHEYTLGALQALPLGRSQTPEITGSAASELSVGASEAPQLSAIRRALEEIDSAGSGASSPADLPTQPQPVFISDSTIGSVLDSVTAAIPEDERVSSSPETDAAASDEDAATDLAAALSLAEAKQGIMSDPTDPDAWAALGDAYRRRLRRQQAREAYEQALNLEDEHPGAQAGMMALRRGTNRNRVVRDAMNNPNNDELWGDAGDYYMAEGMTAEALNAYTYALTLDPDDAEWQRKVVELAGVDHLLEAIGDQLGSLGDEGVGDLADTLRNDGRTEEACEMYVRAQQMDPSDSEWRDRVAECNGETPEAATANNSTGRNRRGSNSAGRDQRPASRDQRPPPASNSARTPPPTAEASPDQPAIVREALANPDSDELWGDVGDYYMSVQQADEALQAYSRALQLDPSDIEWQRKISALRGVEFLIGLMRVHVDGMDDEEVGDFADILREAGQNQAACEMYARAQHMDPTDPEWRNRTEDCSSVESDGSSKRDAASSTARTAPPATGSASTPEAVRLAMENPDNDEIVGDAGDYYMSVQQRDDALQAYTRALQLDPSDSEWQGKVVELAGVEYMTQVVGPHLSEMGDESVGNVADFLREGGYTREACSLYGYAQQLDPADSEWRERVEECGGSAVQQPTAANTDPSQHPAIQNAVNNPNDDEAWGDAGDHYMSIQRQDDALQAYTRALQLDPTDSEWQRKLTELRGADHVIGILQAQLNNLNDEGVGDLGDLLREAGQNQAACEMYTRAQRMDPSDSEWRDRVAECGGSVVQQSATTYADPSQHPAVQNALRNPEDDEAWGDAGDYYISIQQRDDALQAYTRALQLDPSDSEWRNKLTELRGMEYVIDVLRSHLGSMDDEGVGDFADLLRETGQHQAACEMYARAQRMDPSDSEWRDRVTECGATTSRSGSPSKMDNRSSASGSSGSTAGSSGGNASQHPAVQHALRNPNDDEAWGDAGDYYISIQRRDDALQAYTRAAQLDPGDNEWLRNITEMAGVQYLIGVLDPYFGRMDDEGIGNVADVLRDEGHIREACALYSHAQQLDPSDSEWRERVMECGGGGGGGGSKR